MNSRNRLVRIGVSDKLLDSSQWGHARSYVAFESSFVTSVLGYNVRYVQNITDVGHLTDEAADAGEDKVERKPAKVETDADIAGLYVKYLTLWTR